MNFLRKTIKKTSISHFAILKWTKLLNIILIILITIYILKPKLTNLIPISELESTELEPNIILITLDTLRADHLSCYGYERKTSPFIDKIANEGILFEECIATSPWTLPSHASIFTGLYPSEHGTISRSMEQKRSPLPSELTTLAEILKEQGYCTGAFIGGPYLASDFKLNQGFDYYNDRLGPIAYIYFTKLTFLDFISNVLKNKIGIDKLSSYFVYHLINIWNYLYDERFTKDVIVEWGLKKDAKAINATVFPWIERYKNSKFFLFINYFDPHAPYVLPRGHKNYYKIGYRGKLKGYISELEAIQSNKYTPTDDDLNFLISLYDSQINFLDSNIQHLFDKLVSCGIENKTTVIITSDHGESFGEHGLMQHGFSLYEDQIKVPLIIWGIEQASASQRITAQVQTIDIMPTILDIVNLPTPKDIQGKSILPHILYGKDFGRSYALAELFGKGFYKFGEKFERDLKCVRTKKYKYISSSNGNNEVYNLIKDEKETKNLIGSQSEISEKMEALLKETISSLKKRKYNDQTKPLYISDDIKEKLRGLGYVNQ